MHDRVRAQLEADAWQIMVEQVQEGNIESLEAAAEKFEQWKQAWLGGVPVRQEVSIYEC